MHLKRRVDCLDGRAIDVEKEIVDSVRRYQIGGEVPLTRLPPAVVDNRDAWVRVGADVGTAESACGPAGRV